MASQFPIMAATKVAHTILPAAITATTTGTTIDTAGFDGVGFIVTVGTVTVADASNYYTLSFEDSDASNMSGATAITTNLVSTQGTLTGLKIAATTGDEVTYTWNYTGGKRYVRAKLTETGTAAGTFAAYVVLTSPGKAI